MPSIERTPTKSQEGDKRSTTAAEGDPSRRLGAVTRKWNEVEVLLSNPTEENRRAIDVHYQELIEKIVNFEDGCHAHRLRLQEENEETRTKFHDWYKIKYELVHSYQEKLSYWISQNPPSADAFVTAEDSASNIASVKSKTSRKSVSKTSSVKYKLLEQRAKLKAQQELSEEEVAFEKFKRQQEDLLNEAKRNLEAKRREKMLEQIEEALSEVNSDVSRRTKQETKLPCLTKDKNPTSSHVASNISGISERALEVFAQAQERLLLPKNELRVFDGLDCTIFTKFLADFDEQIASKCRSDQEKFNYLQRYTSGRPLALVTSCQYKSTPTERYMEARRQLKQHYGDKFKIAEAYLARIEACSPIKHEDGPALEDFATLLLNCKSVMDGVGPLRQLDSPKEMRTIIMKLPYKLRENWRRKVHNWRRKEYEATFADLADYIFEEASVCNTPMYQHIKDPTPTKGKSVSNDKKKSFSTKTLPKDQKSTEPTACLCCKKIGHPLAKCFFLEKKTRDEVVALIKENNLCFSCLKPGHNKKTCKQKLKCSKCNGLHPTCLHWVSKPTPKEESSKTEKDDKPTEGATSAVVQADNHQATNCATSRGSHNLQKRTVICAAVPIRIRVADSNRYVYTYMALDGCSTDSFMDSELLKKIGMEGLKTNLSLSTMGKCNGSISVTLLKNLEVQSLHGSNSVLIPEIFAKEEWPFALEDSPKPQDIQEFEYLKNIPFEFIDEKIGLLIGMNMSELLKPLKIVGGNSRQPYASQHLLGWALNGLVGSIIDKRSICHKIVTSLDEDYSTEEKLEELYSQEFRDQESGILEPSADDLEWESRVKASIKKTSDNHFEIGLPFKNYDVTFPSNYYQVYSRLQSKKRSLQRDPKLLEEYKNFMSAMLDSGFAEMVPDNEIETLPGKVWFLTHFGVHHKQKGKIRIVFDCSLKYKGISLNQALYQGPDLTSSLLSVLLKFRQEKIAFMADIKKMFYQVRVLKEDRDFLRYLWFEDGDLQREPKQYRLKVHVFGAVSSPSCSNYALRRIADINEGASQEAKLTIRNNFYVDDVLKSVPDEESAVSLISEVCTLLKDGGFELVGFVSNSREVLSIIPKDRLSKDLECVDLTSGDDLPFDRALGVFWKIQQDCSSFKIKDSPKVLTKRGVLSSIFSIFDPYGIVIPVILKGRSIFQESCRLKLDWDDDLPEPLRSKWNDWWNEVHLLNEYSINRCYKGSLQNVQKIQLHLFADGSEAGYAAVAYLRMEDENSDIHCSLVMSKARLVPAGNNAMKTIPRIELNAAKLAVEIAQIIKNELEYQLDQIVFWSDSSTVLKYISCQSGRFQRFIANRISFIRSHTSVSQWRHVPGTSNPADLASRGCTAAVFVEDKIWKCGPEFLWRHEDDWPPIWTPSQNDSNDDLEYRKSERQMVQVRSMTTRTKDTEETPVDVLLASSSAWIRTKTKVAWWMKLKKNFKDKNFDGRSLSILQLREAEVSI